MNTRYRWFLLSLIITGILVAYTPFPRGPQEPVHRVIPIAASSFEFNPGVIWINPGDRVTLQLTSTDVVHGFYLDGYGYRIQAEPGRTHDLTFVADRPGTFRFRCSVTCGEFHPFMIGKLQVGPPTMLWRGIGIALLILLAIRFLPVAQEPESLTVS